MTLQIKRYGTLREGGGCLFAVHGARAFARIAWTLASGAGTLTPIEHYANELGIASAYYTATGDVEDDTVEVTASQHVPQILNPTFSIAGNTAYDAAHWTADYAGFTGSFPANEIGRQSGNRSLHQGGGLTGTTWTPHRSHFWCLIRDYNTPGFIYAGCPGGVAGTCYGQVRQQIDFTGISTITVSWAPDGYKNLAVGAGTRFSVYASASTAPGWNSSTDRVYTIDLYSPASAQYETAIDVSSVTGTKWLIFRLEDGRGGAAGTAFGEGFYIDNIREAA